MHIQYDADGYFHRVYCGPYFAGVREDWYYRRDGRATRGLTFDLCARDPNGVVHVLEKAVSRVDGGPSGDYDGVWLKLAERAERAAARVQRADPMRLIF